MQAISGQRVSVGTLAFVEAVNEAIKSYLTDYWTFDHVVIEKTRSKRKGQEAIMLGEKLTIGEMNVELWDIALASVTIEISRKCYPHTATVQALINYLLNNNGNTDFASVQEILARLITFHPPQSDTMRVYYKRLLCDRYAQLNSKGTEKDAFFWVIMDALENLPSSVASELAEWDAVAEEEPDSIDTSFKTGGNLKKKLEELINKKSVVYYDDLPAQKQFKRSSMCFKFICDVLEKDLHSRLKTLGIHGSQVKCLLSGLIWPDVANIGQISPKLNKIINLLFRRDHKDSIDLNRLLSMIAHLVNCADRIKEREYPFFGKFSFDLARAVSLVLLERIQTYGDCQLVDHLHGIEPCWFRLLCCCHILGTLTGFHCIPELPSAITVVEHLLQIAKGQGYTIARQNKRQSTPDPELVAKYSKMTSVNAKYRSGATRLHMACSKENVAIVTALLTFEQLDVNLTDGDGWTALHEASTYGSTGCVRELLSFTPRLGSVQRAVDTRAKGPQNWTPLMLAVQSSHKEICAMLLKHTGSVLLEDITDDNLTALDFCTDEEVRSILMHYKKNLVETIHSRKRLHLITDNLTLIVKLCTILTQCYMATHRTWVVYHKMKAMGKGGASKTEMNVLIQYSRYHRDLKTNLPKLRALTMNLLKFQQVETTAAEELNVLFSLNKS